MARDETPVDPSQPAEEPTPEEPTPEEEQPAEEQPAPAEASAPEVPDENGILEADEADLRELHGQLEAWRVTAREQQDVEGVRNALAQQRRIVEELNRRTAQAEALAQELQVLDAEQVPELPTVSESVTAAGVTAGALSAQTPAQTPTQQKPPAARPRVALQAALGIDSLKVGDEMTLDQLGAAMNRQKESRSPAKTILASLPEWENIPGVPVPLSNMNGVPLNDRLIREAVEDWEARQSNTPVARTGAICEPFDIIRDIPDAFVTAKPVSDIFPSRPAGRGGFQFTPSGNISDVLGAVSVWDEADQAAVDVDDSDTWKPCIEYDCPTPDTAVLEWVTACVTYDNTLDMSLPERVANLNNALQALRARVWEGRVLQRIDQLSHAYVYSGPYGAIPTVIEALNTVVAQLTFIDRQAEGNYTLIVPPAVPQVLTMDRAQRAYNDSDPTSDVLSYILGNVDGVSRVVRSLDMSLGGEPGLGLPFGYQNPNVGNQAAAGAPNDINGGVYRFRLVDPSAALYAETGEMNAGTLKDVNMIRQNKTGYFTEQGFFLEKHGPQPWATIDIHLCADGARAGLITPTGCDLS